MVPFETWQTPTSLNISQSAFDAVKTALSSAPVLALPDPDAPFEVIADASGFGLGAILQQNGRPIAYESRKLLPAERNYTTTEQELLAVVHALRTWRCYLKGAEQFTVHTDHQANTFLDVQRSLSRRQTRWAEFLSRFHIDWKFKPGAKNPADPLSRMPDMQVNVLVGTYSRMRCSALTRQARKRATTAARPKSTLVEHSDVSSESDEEPQTEVLPLPSWRVKLAAGYEKDPWFASEANTKDMERENGLWLKEGKIVVPHAGDLRTQLITELHDCPYSGQCGITKTVKLTRKSYWWPSLHEDVLEHVRLCATCQKNKPRTQLPAGLLQPVELPEDRWQVVTMDFITQLPRTKAGHDAILVMVDKMTKMVHFAPTTTTCTAQMTAKLFVHYVVRTHGVPAKIITDRGPQFAGQFSEAVWKAIGTRQALSTAYHPQTDGQTERVNRVLEDMLRHYVSSSQDDWDELLDMAEFAVNNAHQETIGTSPFILKYGFSPRMPTTIQTDTKVPTAHEFVQLMSRKLLEAQVAHRAATARQKRYYDARHRLVEFEVGQWVLLNSNNLRFKSGSPKLLPRWVGPFQIHKRVGEVAYELVMPKRWRLHDVFHVSLLEPFRHDGAKGPPPAELLSGEVEYEVEEIVDHKDTPRDKHASKFTRQYLVRWRGSDPEHNTWEPTSNLRSAAIKVQEYWDSKGIKSIPKGAVTSVQSATVPAPLHRSMLAVRIGTSSPISKSRKRRQRKKLASNRLRSVDMAS